MVRNPTPYTAVYNAVIPPGQASISHAYHTSIFTGNYLRGMQPNIITFILFTKCVNSYFLTMNVKFKKH